MMSTDLVEVVRRALHRGGSVRPTTNGFPYFAEALHAAGITTVENCIPAGVSVYHLERGAVASSCEPIVESLTAVPDWDATKLIAAIRTDQAGRSTYPQFLRGAWNAGVIRFRVDLNDRTCTYFGTSPHTYTETYPAVAPPN